MEYFDSQAANWDTDIRTQRAKIIADKIRSLINGGQQKTAMEFGCGTGLIGFQLADSFHSLILVDNSEGMIGKVRQKIDSLMKQNITAMCVDLISNAPADLRFDYIFSSMALHHIEDIDSIFSRFYDLLNYGGSILVVDLDEDDGRFHANEPDFKGHNGFNQASISDQLCKAGFSNVQIQNFYHNSKEVNGEKVSYSLFILVGIK